jgi:hypothetical protein
MGKHEGVWLANQVIDTLQAELESHPEILIATKSGRLFTEAERVEFFRTLRGPGQASLDILNPLIKPADAVMISMNRQQTPTKDIMETINQFGKWVEDTLPDPALLMDGTKAIVAVRNSYTAGTPISPEAGSSLLLFILQVGAKLLGAG